MFPNEESENNKFQELYIKYLEDKVKWLEGWESWTLKITVSLCWIAAVLAIVTTIIKFFR